MGSHRVTSNHDVKRFHNVCDKPGVPLDQISYQAITVDLTRIVVMIIGLFEIHYFFVLMLHVITTTTSQDHMLSHVICRTWNSAATGNVCD